MSRPRLLDVLDAAVESASLSLVTAGPGAGKSVLLTDWARRRRVRPAWLSLSRADNDPTRFWQLFVAAVAPAVADPIPTVWSGEATGLLDSIFGEERPGSDPAVVVLDEAHLLTNPAVLDGLDRVVQRWSHRVRVVMSCRSVPLLPLHRYRLAGQLAELRADDLAMTESEAVSLFAAHDVAVSGEDLGRVLSLTEGWTGGLRLMALRMESSPSPREVVDQLALDEGSIGEYLVEEVLSVEPAQVRRLLIETSFLDEISSEAAEAITGIDGAGDILARLARRNSFVLPLDPSYTRFRYHHLLGEVLRHLARRRPAREASRTTQQTVAWFRATGDVAAAVQCALQSGDRALARTALVRGGLAQAFVASDWLLTVPLEELAPADDPLSGDAESEAARVAVAALRLYRDRLTRAVEGQPAHLPSEPTDRRPSDQEPTDPELRLTVRVARLVSVWVVSGSEALAEAAEPVLADDLRDAVDAVRGLRSLALLMRPRAAFAAGRMKEIQPGLFEALDAAKAEQAVGVELEVLGVIAFIEGTAGRVQHATDALARAADLLRRHPEITATPLRLHTGTARLAYVRGELGLMADAVRRALAAGPIYANWEEAASVTLARALLLSATGRMVEARRWLQAPVLNGPGLGQLAPSRDAELAAIETALGRPERALVLLEGYDDGPFALATAVAAAEALLATGQATAAERRLQPVFTDPTPQVNRLLLVSAFLCRVQIALHRGDEVGALEDLSRARDVAGGDIVMPFVRATPALLPLLARHPAAAADWPAALPAPVEDGDAAGPPTFRVPEPLTEREKSVLRLLSTTMSTAEISAQLLVSVNTVKTHVASIYRKLGVTRRRDAVQAARALELL